MIYLEIIEFKSKSHAPVVRFNIAVSLSWGPAETQELPAKRKRVCVPTQSVYALGANVCVVEWERSSCPPKCSWMSHPICSLSPRHKWTLHPLVRWLISAPPLSLISSPSRIHSVHTASSAVRRVHTHTHECTHAHTLTRTTLPVKINERDRCIIQHINLEMVESVFCLSALAGLLGLLWKMIKLQDRQKEGKKVQREKKRETVQESRLDR